MAELVRCQACGMADPPAEMTCDVGTPDGMPPVDHFVGTDAGCPGCGRLVRACALRPCSARRAALSTGEGSDD